MKVASLVLLSLLVFSVHARQFERVTIPGAKCGSGLPYSVFVDMKNTKKLAIEFMGGGACWSASTCYGPAISTWLFPMPKLPHYSVFTLEDEEKSPVHDHSLVYFPYCTGDVFAANHTARYAWGMKVHHHGKKNVERALDYLIKQGYIDFNQVEDFVLYGMSAGSLGAFANLPELDALLKPGVPRTFIADSPGMHFGDTFWHKFTPELFRDFKKTFERLGLEIDYNEGNVAYKMAKVCEKWSHWNFGIMQASRDFVMSLIFGEISQKDHEKAILSDTGILNTIKDSTNCSTWIPKASRHTFLLYPWLTQILAGMKNPVAYAYDVIRGVILPNYVDDDLDIWDGHSPENYVETLQAQMMNEDNPILESWMKTAGQARN